MPSGGGRYAGGQRVPWTPALETSLEALYDPSNVANYVTVGGNVSSLTDLSGKARNLAAAGTSATRPIPASVTIGSKGLFGLDFNGTTHALILGSITTPAVNVGTWAFVFRIDSAGQVGNGFGRIGLGCGPASGNDYDQASAICTLGINNFSLANMGVVYNNGFPVTSRTLAVNTPYLYVVQRDGSVITTYLNGGSGSSQGSLGTTNFGFTRLVMGRTLQATDYYDGRQGETMWFSSADTSLPGKCATYLNDKWGIY